MPAERKYALLLDGGFVTKALRPRLRRFPTARDVIDECERISSHRALLGGDLLRIYWYDAAPATGVQRNPIDGTTTNLGKTLRYKESKALQDALELTPNFALRMGVLDVRGWRMRGKTIHDVARRPDHRVRADDIDLDIGQKGVDLRLGLDIARLSIRAQADTLVVVTGDSDLVPAFKFARREGLRVYLDVLGARSVMRALKVHVDRVL